MWLVRKERARNDDNSAVVGSQNAIFVELN